MVEDKKKNDKKLKTQTFDKLTERLEQTGKRIKEETSILAKRIALKTDEFRLKRELRLFYEELGRRVNSLLRDREEIRKSDVINILKEIEEIDNKLKIIQKEKSEL